MTRHVWEDAKSKNPGILDFGFIFILILDSFRPFPSASQPSSVLANPMTSARIQSLKCRDNNPKKISLKITKSQRIQFNSSGSPCSA